MSAPWFIPPRDVLVNGIAAAAILIAVDLTPAPHFRTELEIIRWTAAVYCAAVSITALVALFLHDRNQREGGGRFVFRLTGIFGRGEILYTPAAVISIVGTYQDSFATIAWLTILWILFTVARPIELIASAWRQWGRDTADYDTAPSVGIIDQIDHPNIVRVRLNPGGAWKPHMLHVAAMPDGRQQYVLSLFTQVQGTEVIGTGLCVAEAPDELQLPGGHVCASHNEEKAGDFIEPTFPR